MPDPLPANPLEIAAEWLRQAQLDAAQPNPNSMVLATVDARGQPSARVILCKEISPRDGSIVFYTNYESRKGRELAGNARAALVFHWDHRHRQVRAEGRVERLSNAENDAYFRSRPWQSRIGAWASEQSEPIESRAALVERLSATSRRFGVPDGVRDPQPADLAVEVPRPAHWGGYRLRAESVELWVEGEFRIHDRARWTRTIEPGREPAATLWSVSRLQP